MIHSKFRIGAVSYLNTVPLIWGMLHGRQKADVDLSFSIPSVCATQVEENAVQLGLVPAAEIVRQGLEMVPGVGITCLGAVRSILLFSSVPWRQVRTLAADLGSRTSVHLARIILRERYGVEPQVTPSEPALGKMLSEADAALIIGDSALQTRVEEFDPLQKRLAWLDLGAEWFWLTGLPMVFAAWAGKPGIATERFSAIARASYDFGKIHLNEIVDQEHTRRGITKELAERYLRKHIRFEMGSAEQQGFQAFLELARLEPSLTHSI